MIGYPNFFNPQANPANYLHLNRWSPHNRAVRDLHLHPELLRDLRQKPLLPGELHESDLLLLRALQNNYSKLPKLNPRLYRLHNKHLRALCAGFKRGFIHLFHQQQRKLLNFTEKCNFHRCDSVNGDFTDDNHLRFHLQHDWDQGSLVINDKDDGSNCVGNVYVLCGSSLWVLRCFGAKSPQQRHNFKPKWVNSIWKLIHANLKQDLYNFCKRFCGCGEYRDCYHWAREFGY